MNSVSTVMNSAPRRRSQNSLRAWVSVMIGMEAFYTLAAEGERGKRW
jgi:hypothetical protein